jgi:hypothetical protein
MANMSYCRFQNTVIDLQDCVNVLEDAYEPDELDLSKDEERAMHQMKEWCEDFLRNYDRLEAMKEEMAEDDDE